MSAVIMKRLLHITILFLFITISIPAAAQESEDTLVLGFSRDFGFAARGKIQGTFSLKVRQPEDLVRVEFIMDGEIFHTDTESPFRVQFNTASYSVGGHTLSAVGYRADGTQIHSVEITRDFISAENAWDSVRSFAIPLLVVVGGVTVLGILLPTLLGRKKTHRPGEYGMAGGAVCRRCEMPFSRNFISPNLVVGKLVRCPHCGKWNILPRASSAELQAAEERLTGEGTSIIETPSEEERLRSSIDDSRFD